MTKLALIPRQVTLGAELKFFGLEKGASDSTPVSMTFDIPDGLEGRELKLAMWEQEYQLCMFVLYAERMKGSVSDAVFNLRKDTLKKNFDKLLGKETVDGQG